jgi:hypothetical protein
MFKSYFLLSMELVRGVVKVMEEGMLDNFDDEASKPVSAAFGAPSTLNENDNENNTPTDPAPPKDESLVVNDSSSMNSSFVDITRSELNNNPATAHSSRLEELEHFDAKLSEVGHSPASLDVRPALAFMPNDEHIPVMEYISNDAIEEMVDQVFIIAGAEDDDEITFEQFERVVESDVNILAWIEALGSVF